MLKTQDCQLISCRIHSGKQYSSEEMHVHKVVHDPAMWPARANIQFESEGAASTFNYLTPITTNSGGAKTYIQHGALPDSIRKG